MPSRPLHHKDPFPNVTNWDDGYEYIGSDGPVAPGADAPYYSPAGSVSGAPRDMPRAPPGRASDPYSRRRYHSPVSAADTFSRPRPARAEYSPPRRSRRLSPSPERRGKEMRYPPQASQGRPARSLGRSASYSARHDGVRERPRYASYSRSPSPPRTRRGRDEARYDDYRRADSPPRAMSSRAPRRAYSPSPPRHGAPPGTRPRRAQTYRAPSPPRATMARDGGRSSMGRSKSLSAKAKGFTNLSPRWQKAASAAFQAGSATAFNLRSEPGAWKGDKGFRVATAALGAGAVDAFTKGDRAREARHEREPDREPERESRSGGSRGKSSRRNSNIEALGGALGGLILEQIASRAASSGKKYRD